MNKAEEFYKGRQLYTDKKKSKKNYEIFQIFFGLKKKIYLNRNEMQKTIKCISRG